MRKLVHRMLRLTGWEISRYDVENSQWLRLVKMLNANRVTVVLDIGASTGGFASSLFSAGFIGRVVSFEPLSSSHSQLMRAAKDNDRWVIAPRMALGPIESTVTINISGNTGSSSVLPLLSRHLEASPASSYISQESARMAPLDDIAHLFIEPNDVVFLKLDVQGFEHEVLKGARSTVARAVGVVTELSFVQLYESQLLFDQMSGILASLGFAVWAFFPAFTEETTGRMLQMDGVFFRDECVQPMCASCES